MCCSLEHRSLFASLSDESQNLLLGLVAHQSHGHGLIGHQAASDKETVANEKN